MQKIGFIGLGLIGGSLARIWKKLHPQYEILVFHHHKEVPFDYKAALSDKTVDRITFSLEEFSDADLILLCTPVISIVDYLEALKDIISESCIITDVGSVKGRVAEAAKEFGLTKCFIGGHPMAGSEKTGYLNAKETLFENAYYILTPFPDTPGEKLERLKGLIEETGAVPILMEGNRHDEVTAGISHVPHIVASSLVNAVAEREDEMMELLAAGGFRDITRIASSSPSMWRDICLSNRGGIVPFLERLIEKMTELKRMIVSSSGEDLYHFFAEGKEFRDSLPLKKSNMAVSHEILLYVPDEPGEIAIIASILAARGISIKNIGIAHNREYAEGVLRVEFYDLASLEAATRAIKERNYQVYDV